VADANVAEQRTKGYNKGMTPDLTDEQRQALEESKGFVRGPSYILMSTDMFRQTMGVTTDEEMSASLDAIKQAMNELAAGHTIPLDEAKTQLDQKYGVSD
jgi:hypothetical protein